MVPMIREWQLESVSMRQVDASDARDDIIRLFDEVLVYLEGDATVTVSQVYALV